MQMKGPTGAKYSISDSGWMESEQLKLWFSDIFLDSTKNLTGPKILPKYMEVKRNLKKNLNEFYLTSRASSVT